MITTIKFSTSPAKSTESALGWAREHPLFQGITSSVSADGSESYAISFGKVGLEFAQFTFFREALGPIVLASVGGNLPALLWGHEGRLIQNQKQLELALTRLRWLGSGLVAADDADLLLPHVRKINTGYISELGLAIQVEELPRRLFNAGRFSTVNGSNAPPVLATGRTILHGTNVTWEIRNVRVPANSFTLGPVTRLECRIRDAHLLAKAVRVKYTNRYFLAALPFENLFELFKRATKETLGGGLAEPSPYRSDEFADAVRRVVRQSHYPEAFHQVLQFEHLGMSEERANKLRRRVFREISNHHNVCLQKTLNKEDFDKQRRDAPDQEVEISHVEQMRAIGCPEAPDEAISETFCGPLLLYRDAPTQRIFFNLEDGLPY